jgi:chlorophyll(ide) b reductase
MAKVVVITGGTRGLGYALANEFSKKNYSVVISGRNITNLKKAKISLKKKNPSAFINTFHCDISQKYCAQKLASFTKNTHGEIDYWINNAATCENKRDVFSNFSNDEIYNILNVNLCGTLYSCKAASEIMTKQASGGKIINIDGSGSNGEIIPGFLVYSTSKANISYIGKFLDTELKYTNVQVHTISPGIMETEFLQNIENRNFIFNSLVQHPEYVAEIMVKQIETVNGRHKHINVYTISRLFALLLNAFKDNNL